VHERPLVRTVTIEGAENVKTEEVEQALRVRRTPSSIPDRLREGVEAAKKLYGEKGYPRRGHHLYATTPVGENEVDVAYTVKEGDLVRIGDIEFEGNEAFSGRELRGIMQTKEEWIFSFVTGAGNLNKDVLKADIERLHRLVLRPRLRHGEDRRARVERAEGELKVVIKVNEGEAFTVGKVGSTARTCRRRTT
jgi:outer membrane protein insertion porin family